MSTAASFSLHPLVNSITIQKPFIKYRPSKATSSISNEDSTEQDSGFIKAPTAPWMKGPLLVQENQIMKFSRPRTKRDPNFLEIERTAKDLFGKEGGGRGKKAMKQVYQGFENLQKSHNLVHTQKSPPKMKFKFSPGTLFGDESSNLYELNVSDEEDELVDTRNKLENNGIDSLVAYSKKMPWEKDEKLENSSLDSIVGSHQHGSMSLDRLPPKRGKGDSDSMQSYICDNREVVVSELTDEKLVFERGKKLENNASHQQASLNRLPPKQGESDREGVSGLIQDKAYCYSKKMPWEKDEKLVLKRVKKERVKTAAELNVDAVLLERLRGEAKTIRKWVKVKKAGVTQSVVDQIRFIWRDNELAMVKFDVPLCRNMERAQEITESKTGGFVVRVNKDELFVYRGCNYHSGQNIHHQFLGCQGNASIISNIQHTGTRHEVNYNDRSQDDMSGKTENDGANLLISGTLYEREADRVLDGLGPRFIDWWGRKPLPVDADLLPEVVPGFKPPLRLCPPGVRSKLTDEELTHLRMLARQMPTHFVLGRNRKLQGMAVSILKLWEKCHIAKIAVKFGVPNTDNEQMANELKLLTGGTLLLRNKFVIILYRGKDFLPPHVANLVVERESALTRYQNQEEAARLVANEHILVPDEIQESNSTIGTLSEFQSIHSECTTLKNGTEEVEIELRSQKKRIEDELRRQRQKLFILRNKIERSERHLRKINRSWQPSEPAADQEVLTEEERECLRMIGLKMDSNLILGRRGVFDGVIEGLHQYWKHKEVVKVITMQRRSTQIMYTAKLLTAESGGILVSIEKLKEGHAIIIYRGKNYVRPAIVRNSLPSKADALRRSLLMQRIGSLKFFANQEEQAILGLTDKQSALEEKIHHLGIRMEGYSRCSEQYILKEPLMMPDQGLLKQ